MKNIILTIPLFFLLSLSVKSQITEGCISFSITMSSDVPEMEMLIGMLDSSKMNLYFNKENTRAEMKMGKMMSVTTITALKTKEMLMLMEGNGQKNAFKSPIPKINKDSLGYKITLSEETKKIQNYICKKAISTDSVGVESIYWYTNEININLEGQTYFNAQIPGVPLEYELINNGLKMIMTASAIEKKISKEILKTVFQFEIPEGYTILSTEDLLNMQ